MATAKKRLNISMSESLEKALGALAKRDQVPAATKAAELLRHAIEVEEDDVWEEMASTRLRTDKRRIPHDEAWK